MGKRSLDADAKRGSTNGATAAAAAPDPVKPQSSAPRPDTTHTTAASDYSASDSDIDAAKPTPAYNHPPSKRQRKQLSAQEIQVARETAELFKSNIFKLQIDELIKEVRLKELHVARIEQVLHRLHEVIAQVPACPEWLLAEAEQHFAAKRCTIPWPEPRPARANYKFAYRPPLDVSLVGSFGLKTGILQARAAPAAAAAVAAAAAAAPPAANASIDIALTMPRELFQPKDYLNYRAFYKRAFYVAWLAEHLVPLLRAAHLPVKVQYTFANGDVLCPALRLESIHTDNEADLHFDRTRFCIQVVVGFPFGVFDAKKVLPDKNCIRIETDAALPATPLYNLLLMLLTAYDYYLKYLYTLKKLAELFKDACILGRLWLQQRGLGLLFARGGFGHFEFAVLMAALLQGGGVQGNRILLHGFLLYQLFKGTIKYLATQDLCDGYLSFLLAFDAPHAKYSPEGFGAPTVFDKSVKLNVLWKMTPFSYRHVQQQAAQLLQLLNDVVFDRFEPILLRRLDVPQLQYDLVATLAVPATLAHQFGATEKISFLTFERWALHRLYQVLRAALGERATAINVWPLETALTFGLTKRRPAASATALAIGLTLNPDECDKLVTKGPNQTDAEAGAKFRAFWGARASLRRFKDGSIQHCVVWPPPLRGEPVALAVVKHCLDAHLLEGILEHVSCEAPLYARLLPPALAGGAAGGFTGARNAFDAFVRALAQLDLPLGIKSVLPGAAPALRLTLLLQPVPFAASLPDFWSDVVLQFESSTKWPDEISSLEKVKAAMLLKLHELLPPAYRTHLTADDQVAFNVDVCCLNVLTPEGFGLRVRILTERDEVLYLRAIANAPALERALVQDAYLKFNQVYLGSIKHSRTVTQLSHHFAYYSATVRVFKKWLDAHLLLSHMTNELAELLALKAFVDPAPYAVAHLVETGFLHTLEFLAHWNWREDPLVLDLVKHHDATTPEQELKLAHTLTDRLTPGALQVIELNFGKIRQADPSAIRTQLFVALKDDPSGILWSNALTLPIASRLTALARLLMLLVKRAPADESLLALLFTPALQDYDFTIKVRTNSLTVSSGLLPPNQFKNLVGELAFPQDICTQYDLIQEFCNDLNRKFGNVIIFLTLRYTGLLPDGALNVIAGLFVPTFDHKRKFRVGLGLNVKPTGPDECVINKEALFNQIALLGGDLVESIAMRK